MDEIYEDLNARHRYPTEAAVGVISPTQQSKQSHYSAKVYFDGKVLTEHSGDDSDQLQAWVLDKLNHYAWGNGEIIDNADNSIIARHRKSY